MTLRLIDGLVTSPSTLVWARRDLDLPVFLEDGGRTWTWRTLANAASEVATRLGQLDGARVTVTAPNGGAVVAAIVGVWLAGGVPAPISPKLPAAERRRLLDAVRAEAHIVHDSLALDMGSAVEVRIGDGFADATQNSALAPAIVDPADPGIVLCTSGTTGTPKIIVHSMRAVWGQVDSVTRHVVDSAELPPVVAAAPSRVQSAPMVHISAIFSMMFNLWRGRSVVIMPRFEPIRFAELVALHRIEALSLVPSMIRMLLDSPVGSLAPATLVTSGTAALPPAWRDEFETRFGVPVQTTYGQTEAGTIAYEPVADVLSGNRRPGTAGKVVPGIEVVIRDDEGEAVPLGEVGHIWIRGQSLSRASQGDPAGVRLIDGWLDTGDNGRLDADRYLYLTGRSRDLIIRGGLNVIPAEVENALAEHPDVLEAAVTGRPDARLGEVPVAWLRMTADPDADELTAFLRERVAAYKVPVAYRRVEDFPRTDTGKIRKQELEEGAGT